jgi:hypothetical protein
MTPREAKDAKEALLTADRLRELLNYNQETGVFTWRVRLPHSNVRVGDIAGSGNMRGYRRVWVVGRSYSAHRLACCTSPAPGPRKLIIKTVIVQTIDFVTYGNVHTDKTRQIAIGRAA